MCFKFVAVSHSSALHLQRDTSASVDAVLLLMEEKGWPMSKNMMKMAKEAYEQSLSSEDLERNVHYQTLIKQ